MSRHSWAAAVVAILLLGLSACGGSESGGGDGESGGGDGAAACVEVETSGDEAAFMADYEVPAGLETKPEIKMDGCGDPPTRLVTEDLLTPGIPPGTRPARAVLARGPVATVEEASIVTFNYVGVLWPDGKEFDTSWSRKEPATYAMTGVIPGWSTGLAGMKEGGRRLLVIPPELAYGSRGKGSVTPNSTVAFVIDVLEVEQSVQIPEALKDKPAVTVPAGAAPPTALEITDEIVGDGPEAHAGDTITIK